MADSFVKLWQSILESSIWSTPDRHRLVWITMLVMADQHGFVGASIDGLARRANVPVEDAERAIESFLAPDPRSRSDVAEGRRIEKVARGWHILNHGYFRDLRDKEARKEYERERKRKQRGGQCPEPSGTVEGQDGTDDDLSRMSAHAEASASASASAQASPKKKAPRKRVAPVLVEKPDEVNQAAWDDWIRYRTVKHKPLTATAWAALVREAEKAGWTIAAAVQECAERPWISFKADWVSNKTIPFQSRPPVGYVSSNSHVQNTPLGSITCQCNECVKFREKRGIRGIGGA